MSAPSHGVLTYPYMRIEAAGPRRPLVIAFADAGQKPGAHAQYKRVQRLDCGKIFLNAPADSWYLDGIPGLGSSLPDAATALVRIIEELEPSWVVTVGASMGGYAAIAFGALIRADRILAFSPEALLKLPGSPSGQTLEARQCGTLGDLLPLLQEFEPRSLWLTASEGDIIDLRCAKHLATCANTRAVSLRATGHIDARALDGNDTLHGLLDAALEPDSEMPVPAMAGDLLDASDAIAAAFDAHVHLFDKQPAEAETKAAIAVGRRPDWALAHHLQGRALALLGCHKEAESAQQQAIALDPGQAAYHHHLGLALAQLGRYTEAAAAQQVALDLGWSNPWALHHLGSALLRGGDLPGAEAAYRKAVERRPKAALFHHHLGIVLLEQDRPAEAELAARQAVALEPGNAAFHAQLGRVLEAQGRLAEAEEAVRRAQDLEPEKKSFARHLAALAKRLDSPLGSAAE